MGWPQFEHHLVLVPQVKLLQMHTATKVPYMNRVPKSAVDHVCEVQAIFEQLRRPPLAGNGHIVSEMPPEVIPQKLRATINFPAAQDLEVIMVQDKHSARSATVLG